MEYLYRVTCNGDVVYEGTNKDDAELISKIMKNKKVLTFKRSELVWWPVPPENVDTGVT